MPLDAASGADTMQAMQMNTPEAADAREDDVTAHVRCNRYAARRVHA